MSFGLNFRLPEVEITADPAPNTTAPSEERIMHVPGQTAGRTGTATMYAFQGDGTSLKVTTWIKVDDMAEWFLLSGPTAVVKQVLTLVTSVPSEARVFVQVTDPVGAPTKLGFAFR